MPRARVYAALLDAGAEKGPSVSIGLVRSLAGLEWWAFERAALALQVHGLVELEEGPSPCGVAGPNGENYAFIGLKDHQPQGSPRDRPRGDRR